MKSNYSQRTEEEKQAERDAYYARKGQQTSKQKARQTRGQLCNPTRRKRNKARKDLGMTMKAYRKHERKMRRAARV
jgi:hypothetical protein